MTAAELGVIEISDVSEIRAGLSLRRRLVAAATEWVRGHTRSLLVVLPLLAGVGLVHAWGMSTFPRWVDDPGTYLSQAWSFQYLHGLSPYSYFYDHAPAGWIQMGLWSMLTDGFNRYGSAIGFGNECMLIGKLASAGLLYVLGRRLGLSRAGSAAAVLVFGLNPLAVTYTRWTFLDNLVTPWLLLAFVLAYSPRRSIGAATGAALSFAMAVLTKETALVVLPAFVWAMAQNSDRRNRPQASVVAGFSGLLLMAMYPLYAVYKGELLAGAGHNSLIATAAWQLSQRQSSGSVLDPHSQTRAMLDSWLGSDRYLLLAGLVAIPVALLARRLRPVALVLLIQWLVLARGGYVPFMHVVNLLPWSGLVLAGAVEAVAGNVCLVRAEGVGVRRRRLWPPPRLVRQLVAAVAATTLAVVAVAWAPPLRRMMTVRAQPPLLAAEEWTAANVPRDKVLVVHDTIWTDLVHRYGYQPWPIMAYKLDSDPAVRAGLHRIDYLIVPNWYYASKATANQYPTLVEARKHAVVVARFGSGGDGVRIYRVSRHWEPG